MNEIDAGGVAALLGVSRQHFTDRIAKRADFPRPERGSNLAAKTRT